VSSKKELVVIGDSFCSDYIRMRNMMADDNEPYLLWDKSLQIIREFEWTQKKLFPIWGEIVAKELNLKFVNLSQSGTGTNYIFAELLDYLIKNKKNIEKVIISWSGCSRFDFEFPGGNSPVPYKRPWMSICTIHPAWIYPVGIKFDKFLTAVKKIKACSFESGINNFFRHVYVLQNLLESHGTDYRMIQSVSDGYEFTKEGGLYKYAEKIINNPYFDLINDEKFIGWPGIENLGGFTMVELISAEDNKNHISDVDHHPNENGMKIIANTIIKNL